MFEHVHLRACVGLCVCGFVRVRVLHNGPVVTAVGGIDLRDNKNWTVENLWSCEKTQNEAIEFVFRG